MFLFLKDLQKHCADPLMQLIKNEESASFFEGKQKDRNAVFTALAETGE